MTHTGNSINTKIGITGENRRFFVKKCKIYFLKRRKVMRKKKILSKRKSKQKKIIQRIKLVLKP